MPDNGHTRGSSHDAPGADARLDSRRLRSHSAETCGPDDQACSALWSLPAPADTIRLRRMSTYLVTGAAGFIGSALVRALLEQVASRPRARQFQDRTRTESRGFCGTRSNSTRRRPERSGPSRENLQRGTDVVLHQAAIPSVPKSIADPLDESRANIDGTDPSCSVAARDAGVTSIHLCRVILRLRQHADASQTRRT